MHRSRSILLRARRSFSSEPSKTKTTATECVDKAAASAGSAGASPQLDLDDKTPQSIRYRYKLLYHHIQPDLFAYRHPGSMSTLSHHLSSSLGTVISLCSTQEDRDRFLRLTEFNPPSDEDDEQGDDDDHEGFNGVVINTNILGQSDMGFMKVLTLYQDLNNPLYQKYPKFDVPDFMHGCGWALEHFHKTKDELMPKLINMSHSDDGEVGDDNEDGAVVENKEEEGDTTQTKPKYNFIESAMEDPDSLENTLMTMTTPEVMEHIQRDGISRLLIGAMRMGGSDKAATTPLAIVRDSIEADTLREYYEKSSKVRHIKEDTKVMNVALLSARVEEIYPPSEEIEKMDNDPDKPLEDDSLKPHREDHDSKVQVVTQLEVLYELQQSSINDDDKVHTQTSVMVGKFETCLEGDPDGDELKWRLCSYRPAVEFGYFDSL